MKFSKTSVALLLIQVALVSSIAAKYLYQRWSCPRVWVRAAMYDPELLMRGRYVSMQLQVNGCKSTLPSAKEAQFPRNLDGTTRPDGYSIKGQRPVRFAAQLKVEDNKLLAIRIEDVEQRHRGLMVEAMPGASCDAMRLEMPSDFYIGEHAAIPRALEPGRELWVEVTVPQQGPPRPVQLAVKEGGSWRVLGFQ